MIVIKINLKDTVAAYKEADLFLFPSNIECSPIVLFEACASNTPFLTTDVGNSREIIKWTNGGMLLPTTKDKDGLSHAIIDGSVKVLKSITEDKDLRRKLADNGYNAWVKNFTWEKISKQYENLYKNIL